MLFKDYFNTLANLGTPCIRYQNVYARIFKLKPNVLNCLLSFYGLENEDPYNHLNDFHAICQPFKYENFLNEDVKLILFPVSLKDRACLWFNTIPANSITSWEHMVTNFLINTSLYIKPMLFIEKFQSLLKEKTNNSFNHKSDSTSYF